MEEELSYTEYKNIAYTIDHITDMMVKTIYRPYVCLINTFICNYYDCKVPLGSYSYFEDFYISNFKKFAPQKIIETVEKTYDMYINLQFDLYNETFDIYNKIKDKIKDNLDGCKEKD